MRNRWSHWLTALSRKIPGRNILAAMLLGLAVWMPAQAGTLDEIRSTHLIRLGYGNTPPFSYRDNLGHVRGYSIDICNRIVESLRIRLGLSSLEVQFVERTVSNRVQLLDKGAYDIECSASTSTPERQQSAMFSLPIFFTAARYASLRKHELKTIADLKGRSVSVVLGSVNIALVSQMSRQNKLNIAVVPAVSLQKAFDQVGKEQVSAVVADDAVLAVMIAAAPEPENYVFSYEEFNSPEPYGLMMRKDDHELAEAVNDALRTLYMQGDLPELYDRWFMSSLPGLGINLHLPMGSELRQVIDGK